MLIEIPLMSAIFGMFTHFINVHTTIYKNFTPNITKRQKIIKEGPKYYKLVKKKLMCSNNIPKDILQLRVCSCVFPTF